MTIHKAMEQARASVEMAMGGLSVQPEHDELVRSVLAGEITDDEFDERVLLLLGVNE